MKIIWSIAAAGLLGTAVGAQETAPGTPPEGEYVKMDSILKMIDESAPQTRFSADQGRISVFQKASTFLGMEVKSGGNKTVGKVVDLVFDPDEGRIGYVLLAVKNGEGARNVAVPLSAAKPAQDADHLLLNMSEPLLAAAPGVAENDLPPVDAFQIGEDQQALGAPSPAETGSGSSRLTLPKREVRPPAAPKSKSAPEPPPGSSPE